MTQSTAQSVRAIARAEMTDRIKQVARRHLAADGPNLSLRAVARDLGVVSSAVYRYFGSRDELLTALIIEAYDSMGEAVEEAEAVVARGDLAGRWLAVGRAVRDWALAHPHEYALLYGSPVPGYAAPQDTIGPASRPVVVMIGILRDAGEQGAAAPRGGPRLPPTVRASLERIQSDAQFGGVAPVLFARGITAWAQLFGALSFELFGRLTNTIDDYAGLLRLPAAGDGRLPGTVMDPIFHIVARPRWRAALSADEYRADSLEREGFIHCSFARQVTAVANARYRDIDDLCVLEIDPARLTAPIRVEDSYGSGEAFPHVYGPIPVIAATAVHDLTRTRDGNYRFSVSGAADPASPDPSATMAHPPGWSHRPARPAGAGDALRVEDGIDDRRVARIGA